MLKSKTAKLLYLIILSFFCCFACINCNKKVGFKPGQKVAAKWIDGNYYLATVLQRKKQEYKIKYADGNDGNVTIEDLLFIPENPEVATGDSVIAVWSHSRFYKGIVLETKPNEALIQWADGSEPSLVVFGKIIKK